MRKGDQHTATLPKHPRELRLRLGKAASCDGRSLRLEGMGLGTGERIEGGSVLQAHRLEALLLQHASNVVRLPHEIGWAIDRRHEILRQLSSSSASRSTRSFRRSAAG